MHIQKHRHLLAFATILCGVVVLVSAHRVFSAAVSSVPGAGQIHATDKLPFAGPLSSVGVAEAGTDLSVSADTAVLKNGTVLLRTPGYSRLQALSYTLHLLKGSVYASLQGGTLTVVALDAPVLVAAGDTPFLLPSRYQLQLPATHAKPRPVPESWLEQKMAQLPSTDVEAPTLSAGQSTASQLNTLVSAGNVADLQNIISLASQVHPLLPRLLALRFATDSQFQSAGDDLSSLLPADSADEQCAFGLLALASTELKPMPEAIVHQWLQLSEHAAVRSLVTFTNEVLPLLKDLPSLFEDQGYPLQAKAWQHAKDDFLQFVLPLMSDADRQQVQAQLLQEPVAQSASSSLASQPVIPDEQALSAARNLFLQKGGLFTANTSFTMLAGGLIRISNMYFSTQQGDQRFDMTYDPATDTISDIARNGTQYPNALKLEQFLSNL